MSELHEPKSDALRRLYWRDEILQLVFWIEGERLGTRVSVETLERFLGLDTNGAISHLERLVDDGYLEREWQSTYRLSARGRAEGGRIFAAEFADWLRPAHGSCGRDCWCQETRDEAEACLAERARARLS
ncbi:MAG: hypothetical protein H0W07_06550 [Chloroflexi bacterium]|nr:hypothetical protein [Chloroflexota bacterium]